MTNTQLVVQLQLVAKADFLLKIFQSYTKYANAKLN